MATQNVLGLRQLKKSLIVGSIVASHFALIAAGFFLAGGYPNSTSTLPAAEPLSNALMGFAHGAAAPVSFIPKLFGMPVSLQWSIAPEVYHLGVHSGIATSFFIMLLLSARSYRKNDK